MELSEYPMTPATLRRHVSLTSQEGQKRRQVATNLGTVRPKILVDKNGLKRSTHDFKGFLGPSTPQTYEVRSEVSDGHQVTKRRTQDINALSHALRQCQKKDDPFPPIQSSRQFQNEIRLATEKAEKSETQEEISNLRNRCNSPECFLAHSIGLGADGMHYNMANSPKSITVYNSPQLNIHRAISPPFKTRLIREMLPTINHNRGLVPKADAYKRGYHTAGNYSPSTKRTIDDMDKARCDLILLPTNQKLSIQEITLQTDRYKQIAGHRTFAIQFDEPIESTAKEDSYQRRPYLLQKSPERRRHVPSPAAFNVILEEKPTKNMNILHHTDKNNYQQSSHAVNQESNSSIEYIATDNIRYNETSHSVDRFQDSKQVTDNNSAQFPLMNSILCSPFPII